jgi:ribosome-associated protein
MISSMIRISDTVTIEEDSLRLDFIRASGPGGQHVNKVSTAVQLRFDANSLPPGIRTRLKRIAGKRMTQDAVLIIEARRFRSQEKNREDAFKRLAVLIEKASQSPKPRKPTCPTRASRNRRLTSKKRRADIKRQRRIVAPNLD